MFEIKVFKKSVLILMFVLVFTVNPGFAAPQDALEVEKPESLAEKYKRYKTTLKAGRNEMFVSEDREMVDFSSSASQSAESDFVDYGSSDGLDFGVNGVDFQQQYNDLFQQEDFTQPELQNVSGQFQAQYQQLLTQPDALYKELSARPYQNQGGYKNPGSYNNPGSYSNRGSGSYSSNNASQRQQSNTSNSSYEDEQPALISWIFSTIRYVREHPIISGVIALTLLGLLSLLQIVFRRFARPFG